MLGRYHDIPRSFWDDPYLLGYLFGMTAIAVKLAADDMSFHVGEPVLKAIEQVSGITEAELAPLVLSLQKRRDAQHQGGMAKGARAVFIAADDKRYNADPAVIKARKNAADLAPDLVSMAGPLSALAQVAAALIDEEFTSVARTKLELLRA